MALRQGLKIKDWVQIMLRSGLDNVAESFTEHRLWHKNLPVSAPPLSCRPLVSQLPEREMDMTWGGGCSLRFGHLVLLDLHKKKKKKFCSSWTNCLLIGLVTIINR